MTQPETQAGAVTAMSAARRISIALLGGAALAISLLLLSFSLQEGATLALPGCGGEGQVLDCNHVLRSRWASALGVPVSAWSASAYLVLLGALLHGGAGAPPRRRAVAILTLDALAVAIAAAAVWFVGLQVVEGTFCLYCMSAHVAGLVAAVLILTHRAPRRRGLALSIGALGAAMLVGVQLLMPPPSAQVQQMDTAGGDWDRGVGREREVSILGGRVGLRPHDFPVLGSPDAPYIMVYLFDYTCPYCRALHEQLEHVQQKLGGRLAIVSLPVPMNPQCNDTVKKLDAQHEHACELARLAMGVFRAKPQAFVALDRWLMGGEMPPTPQAARDYALTLVDVADLESALADPWIDEQLQRNITLHRLSGANVVPALIIRHVMLLARPTEQELLDVLRDELGLAAP